MYGILHIIIKLDVYQFIFEMFLLLLPDVVGDNPPGRLGLLLVLDDVVLDGTAPIRPAVEVEGDEGGVEADHPAQVHLLRGGPEGGGGDGGAGLAAARNVVTDQVEGVDRATGEVCQAVRKIIIVWTRNFLDVSQQQHYTEYYHTAGLKYQGSN